MKSIAAAAAILLLAAPLAAQRAPRMPGPSGASTGGSMGFPRPGFIDPGTIERRPVIPMHIGPIPFPPDRPWLRIDTPHFILLSAIGENGARTVAHDLEKLTWLLTGTSAYFQVPRERTRVFLFSDRRNVQPYFDAVRGGRVDASGINLRHPKGSTLLIDTTARGGGGLTPRHEIVHDLLYRSERPLPLWIEEGLAEYYSNAGQPIREHASRLRGRLRMPLQQMFATRADDPRAWTFDYYAQSWAAVTALMRRDPKAFFDFLADVDKGMNPADAIRERYGLTLREFEIAMRKAAAPAASLLLVNAPPVAIEAKPLTRAQLLYELGELLSRVRGREGEAERHLRAALEADEANAAIHLAYAELLLAVPDRAVDARVQAQTAIDHDRALETRATGVIGLSYLAAGDLPSARGYLERVYEADLEFAFPLFTIYVDTNERELAGRVFDKLAGTPHGDVAGRRLLHADVARANVLVGDGKLVEAAKLLRDLAPKMPEKTRVHLETQATHLELIAGPPLP